MFPPTCPPQSPGPTLENATVFAERFGLSGVPVLNTITAFYPLTIAVHTFLFAYKAHEKLFGRCLPKQYRFDQDGEGPGEYVERGRAAVAREARVVANGGEVGDGLVRLPGGS